MTFVNPHEKENLMVPEEKVVIGINIQNHLAPVYYNLYICTLKTYCNTEIIINSNFKNLNQDTTLLLKMLKHTVIYAALDSGQGSNHLIVSNVFQLSN